MGGLKILLRLRQMKIIKSMDYKNLVPWLALFLSLVMSFITIFNNRQQTKRANLAASNADLQNYRAEREIRIGALEKEVFDIRAELIACKRECQEVNQRNIDLLQRLVETTTRREMRP